MWGFGYNEFGALNQGQYSDTSAPVLCEKKKMAKWELKGRIQQVACGWYHTVVVGKQKWYTAPPAEYNKDDLKDPEFLSTEEIAAALAQWATPKFRKTARRDIELPDDAGELMELFDRYLCLTGIFSVPFLAFLAYSLKVACVDGQEGDCCNVHEDGRSKVVWQCQKVVEHLYLRSQQIRPAGAR